MRKYPFFLTCCLMLLLLLPALTPAMAGAPDDPAMEAGETVGDSEAPLEDITAESAEMEGMDGDASMDEAVMEPSAGEDMPAPVASPTPTPRPTLPPVQNDAFTIDVEMGYDGLVVMNNWTPTFITIVNNGGDFDGLLGVNVFFSQSEYDRYEMPMVLASGATKRVTLPIKPQVRQDMYAFELTDGGEIVAEKRVAPARLVAPETVTVGVLSETPANLDHFSQRANGLDTLRGEVWMTIPLDTATFPETNDLMGAFQMLVIDGIDARTLSAAQQQALTTWLLGGGHVFLSGGAKAATGFPFFSQWMEASPGEFAEYPDITGALLSFATVKGAPSDAPIWLTPLSGDGVFLTAERGEGLMAQCRAGDGMIYAAAFDLGGSPLSNWAQMASFWPRLMRQMEPTAYQRMIDRLEQSRWGGNDGWRARNIIDQLKMPNGESGIPVLLLLIAYVALVGFGGYLLLKKLGKREWMWVFAPAASLLFAGILLLMSGGSQMNKPVALTASRIVLDGESAQINTYIGVASPSGGEMTIQTDQHELPTVLTTEDSHYYDDPLAADKLYRPLKQRQRYHLGSDPAVSFVNSDAWDAKMLKLKGLEGEVGSLAASMWMEKDGVHGEAANDTAFHLKDCVVVTSFGYANVGDILPGDKKTFAMLLPENGKPPTDPDDPYKVYPDIMYSTLDFDATNATQSNLLNSGLYNYISAAAQQGKDYDDPDAQRRSTLLEMFEDDWDFYGSGQAYYLFAFNDAIGQMAVRLNGAPVSRFAHTAALGSRVTFEPIGETGVVLFPQGFIPAEVVVDEGDDAKPRLPTDDDGKDAGENLYGTANTYLYLNAPVALRFSLPDWGTYTIEKMTLAGMTYETTPTLFLYNHETDAWDEQLLLSVTQDGAGWAPYIDKSGDVYVRYVPGDAAGRYEGMNMPTITLKGEVR